MTPTDAIPEWWFVGPSVRGQSSVVKEHETEMQNDKSDAERYADAAHAMQSGVALEMNWHPEPTTPKHLRVGVNSAMCDHAALVRLLIAKGVLTEAEYVKEVADEMEREAERYQQRTQQHYGGDTRITLA